MSIQIVSDIHLELRKKLPIIIPKSNYLALLGDIGYPCQDSYFEFIQKQSSQFEKVFLIAGNHEYYHAKYTLKSLRNCIREISRQFPNVIFLDSEYYDLPDDNIRIIGCTLWSNIENHIAYRINDFNNILIDGMYGKTVRLSPDVYRYMHESDIHFIKDTLSDSKGKRVVILTHYGPSSKMNGDYMGSQVESAFTTDLEYLFQEPLVLWASGHVHSNVDTHINGIRCVSNCMGYPGENTGYDENLVVIIP